MGLVGDHHLEQTGVVIVEVSIVEAELTGPPTPCYASHDLHFFCEIGKEEPDWNPLSLLDWQPSLHPKAA